MTEQEHRGGHPWQPVPLERLLEERAGRGAVEKKLAALVEALNALPLTMRCGTAWSGWQAVLTALDAAEACPETQRRERTK